MKRVTVWPQKGLMILASIFMIVSGALASYTTILGVRSGHSLEEALLLVYFWILIPVVYAVDPHRTGFHWLTLTKNGIEYHALFRCKKLRMYSAYPYWARGHYEYYGVVTMHFLTLSDLRLNTIELSHINKVRPSANLLKIKMTKNTFNILMEILPEKQHSQLCNLFPEYTQE